MLNVGYKNTSTSLANMLKNVLSKIIDEARNGFLSGRFTGDNIRLVYDIIKFKHNITGMLLMTAFNSLSFSFVQKVFSFYNFGSDFMNRWIQTLYKSIQSCIIVNGHLSDWFYIHRGCRQGDTLCPYVFIHCAEIMFLLFKNSNNIRGIKCDNQECLISQYADDTTVLLDGSTESFRNATFFLNSMQKFEAFMLAVWIRANRNQIICPELSLQWEHTFKL